MQRRWATAALAAVGIMVVAACGREGTGNPTAAIEQTIRASGAAENAKDVKTFLTYWTDNGLKSYDVGSRADLLAGKTEDFGSEPFDIKNLSDVTANGDKGSAVLDATTRGSKFVKPIFRVKFLLKNSDGKWLIDGFEFIGSPPPAAGTKVLGINAHEYAFDLNAPSVPGNFAIHFANTGKQQHELTFFKAPGPIDVATAKSALENVDGSSFKNVPTGYQVDHLSFAEPGKSADITFAQALAPGTYVFACYIPEGGFGENGPVNPKGKPHIQLGMVNVLTVT